MITCTNCGERASEGARNCPRCGAPLVGNAGSGGERKIAAPGQAELPAWLETLRASDPPAPATGDQQGYPQGAPPHFMDNVDRDALPSWMRPESAEYASADQRPARRPASTSAPTSDDGHSVAREIAAHSLIDQQSLPSWLQESQAATSQQAQRNISAASLVQPDAVPEWMKTSYGSATREQQQGDVRAHVVPSPESLSPLPPQAVTANSLIDPQAIPPWMSGNPAWGTGTDIDRGQGEPGSGGPPNLAAAALIDNNALPNWLRTGGQESRDDSRQGQAPRMDAIQQAPTEPAQISSSLSAPSLIDVNALPEWLRAGTPQEQGQGAQQQNPTLQRGPTPVPPRVENVRVPSRPRSEIGPLPDEQSKVAANAFASMLGVASPAPYFPSQPANSGPLPPQGQPRTALGVSTPADGSYPGAMNYAGGNPAWGTGYQQPGSVQQPTNASAPMSMNGQADPGVKSARRGILETIRSWFSR